MEMEGDSHSNRLKKIFFFNLVLLILLNFPKVNIVSFGGLEQGLRLDDVIFFGFFFHALFTEKYLPFFGGRTGVRLILFMLLSSIIANIFSPSFNYITYIFDLRWLQYFLYPFVFWPLVREMKLGTLKITLIIQLIVSLFQVLILKYYRSDGTMNGPWEVSVVSLLICTYLIHRRQNNLYALITLGIILLAQSRMSLIIFCILIPIFMFEMYPRLKKFKLTIFGSFIFLFIVSIPFINNVVDLSILNNLDGVKELLVNFYEEVQKASDSATSSNFFATYKSSLDGSFAMRFDMWFNVVLKFMAYKPIIVPSIFGISPGQNGVIIDGLYARLLLEFGILGTILFFSVMRKISSMGKIQKLLCVIMLISGLTLDPFTASKIMLTFTLLIQILNERTQRI
jgi:hypothetical protein